MTETANTQSEAQPQGSRLPPVSGYLPLLAHQWNNSGGSQQTFPPVLDACCGGRAFWFDKEDARALFMDVRSGSWSVNRKGRSPITVQPDVESGFLGDAFP